MTPTDPKYVSGDRPVNLRTALRQAPPPQHVNPKAKERLQAIQARSRLGSPLGEQIRAALPVQGPARPGAQTVVGSMLLASGAVGLFVSWLESSLPLAGVGAVALAVGMGLTWRGLRPTSQPFSPSRPLFDAGILRTLDQTLEHLAPELPNTAIARLLELKHLIVSIARQVGDGATCDENFTLEDRLYVTECVRRYLPDSLQAYLGVPSERRTGQMLDEGRNAVMLLENQLDMLRGELLRVEAKLVKRAGEDLLRQQRFLKSKATRVQD